MKYLRIGERLTFAGTHNGVRCVVTGVRRTSACVCVCVLPTQRSLRRAVEIYDAGCASVWASVCEGSGFESLFLCVFFCSLLLALRDTLVTVVPMCVCVCVHVCMRVCVWLTPQVATEQTSYPHEYPKGELVKKAVFVSVTADDDRARAAVGL